MSTDPEGFAAKASIVLAVCAGVIGSIAIINSELSPWLILVVILSIFPLALAFGFIAGFLLPDNSNARSVTEADLWVDDAKFLINEHSDKVLGTFQDAEIYEWVLLEKPGTNEKIKCFYDRTFNLAGGEEFIPPDEKWFCLILPGILYVEEPENISV